MFVPCVTTLARGVEVPIDLAKEVEREIYASLLPSTGDRFEVIAAVVSESYLRMANTWNLEVTDEVTNLDELDGARFSITQKIGQLEKNTIFFQLDRDRRGTARDARIDISRAQTREDVAVAIREAISARLPRARATVSGNTVVLFVDGSAGDETSELTFSPPDSSQIRNEVFKRFGELKLTEQEQEEWIPALREIFQMRDQSNVRLSYREIGNGVQASADRHVRYLDQIQARVLAGAGRALGGVRPLFGRLPRLHSETKQRTILGLIRLNPRKVGDHPLGMHSRGEKRSRRWSILGVVGGR